MILDSDSWSQGLQTRDRGQERGAEREDRREDRKEDRKKDRREDGRDRGQDRGLDRKEDFLTPSGWLDEPYDDSKGMYACI